MKKFISVFLLIISCTQSMVFSMDPAPILTTNTGLSEDQMVTRISNAINEKYSCGYLLDPFLRLSSEQKLDIIQVAQTHYPHITDSAITKLYEQNGFFKQTIDYFIQKASENLEKLTATNIKTIENPKNHQPTDELNKLELPIKAYVMNEVFKTTEHTVNYNYDIVLKGEHLHPITAFDICEFTDQAVTSSIAESHYSLKGSLNLSSKYCSGKLVVWNLKTGKPLYALDETDPIQIVTFSPTGSQFAGAMYTENAIKVWCTQTKQLLHKVSSPNNITSISFSHPTDSLLTAVYHGPFIQDLCIHQWLLTPENKVGELINSYKVYTGREKESNFKAAKYSAEHPSTYLVTPKTELHITKNYPTPLYVCIKAIHKSGDRSRIAQLIESSSSFHLLTDIEIQKVRFEMNRK